MKFSLILISTIAFCISSFANETEETAGGKESIKAADVIPTAEASDIVKSEYFFQAEKGQFVVTPALRTNSQDGSLEASSGELSQSTTNTDLNIEYGITETQAVSLRLSNEEGTQTVGTDEMDREGMSDLQLQYKGRMALQADSSLNYGAYVIHSLEAKEVEMEVGDAPTFNQDFTSTNTVIGGTALTGYVGAQKKMGANTVGARFMQSLWGTERVTRLTVNGVPEFTSPTTFNRVTQKTKFVEEGGAVSELRFFYERSFENANLGVSAKYRYSDAITSTEPTRTTQTSSMNIVGISLTPTYRVNENVEVVGNASYATLLDDEVTYNFQTIDSAELVETSLSGRFTF